MAILAVQQITRAGIADALAAAAAAGDSFVNAGKTFLRVKNGHATENRTVTITSQIPAAALPPGSAKADVAVVIAGLATKMIGPFDPAFFNDANARVVITYSDAAADLTVGAFAL